MFSSQKIVFIGEVTNIRTYSRKTNKLGNIHAIGRGAWVRVISTMKWEIKYNTILIVSCVVQFRWNCIIC